MLALLIVGLLALVSLALAGLSPKIPIETTLSTVHGPPIPVLKTHSTFAYPHLSTSTITKASTTGSTSAEAVKREAQREDPDCQCLLKYQQCYNDVSKFEACSQAFEACWNVSASCFWIGLIVDLLSS